MPEPTETESGAAPSSDASEKSQPEGAGSDRPASEEKDLWASSPQLPEAADDSPPDLESRELCPDGACVGVIGPDGRCGVCGRRAEHPVAAPASTPTAAPVEEAPEDASDEGSPPDFASRRLCSDGACIGVIGPDDRCKVCGKPYTGDPE